MLYNNTCHIYDKNNISCIHPVTLAECKHIVSSTINICGCSNYCH